MPSLRDLKKHLRSIEMTGQLAGAMKTVSAAKYSRINNILQNYADYAAVCERISRHFGSALTEAYPCVNPNAPRGIVVLGSNRGLCGGYNIELLNFADACLADSASSCELIVAGKTAIAHFRDNAVPIKQEFLLPDVVQYSDCLPLLDYVLDLYRAGEISTIEIINQKFINMLTQSPILTQLLPWKAPDDQMPEKEILYLPDRGTALRSAAETCINAGVYMRILESSAGAQAATLMAMRSAFDNAEKSSNELQAAISRKRQSDVTASVIETAGGYFET